MPFRLLPAGAVAGWGLHPLESAALSRRTRKADFLQKTALAFSVDLREAGEKSAGRSIAHDLKDLAFQLSRFQSADKLVERLSANEREEVLPRHRGRDADQSGS